jgi:hypothetical protein
MVNINKNTSHPQWSDDYNNNIKSLSLILDEKETDDSKKNPSSWKLYSVKEKL